MLSSWKGGQSYKAIHLGYTTFMRGIILAGGHGTRLEPATTVISKQLLPIYDKPMIYYPLSTLLLTGIREILIICRPHDLAAYQKLLHDGSHLGISLSYITQKEPQGIAQALTLANNYIGTEPVALILGDNFFYGPGLGTRLARFTHIKNPVVFAYQVHDPHNYGVVSFDNEGKAKDITEKPKYPQSPYAIPGLYFYPPDVVPIAQSITISKRGEYEITDVHKKYLALDRLTVEVLPRGTAWIDTGTPNALLDAALFVRTIEQRQGLKISAPEEIAWRQDFITDTQLHAAATRYPVKSPYRQYLESLILTD